MTPNNVFFVFMLAVFPTVHLQRFSCLNLQGKERLVKDDPKFIILSGSQEYDTKNLGSIFKALKLTQSLREIFTNILKILVLESTEAIEQQS